MTELLVYATEARADAVRRALADACAALGTSVRMELFGTGSLYQRLGKRSVPPPPDLAFWFGPFAARAATIDGYLQAPETVDVSTVGVIGNSGVSAWADLEGVSRLAMADPERSEIGLSILLTTLDRMRQVEGDPDAGWRWWQRRAQGGMLLTEDDAGAIAAAESGQASDALTLTGGTALSDLAPIPHVAGVTSNSRNVDAAKRLLDWLGSRAAASGGPRLDIDWCTQNYVATRQRWAQSGFSPTLTG